MLPPPLFLPQRSMAPQRELLTWEPRDNEYLNQLEEGGWTLWPLKMVLSGLRVPPLVFSLQILLQENCLDNQSTVPVKQRWISDRVGDWLTEISHKILGGLCGMVREDRKEFGGNFRCRSFWRTWRGGWPTIWVLISISDSRVFIILGQIR